MWGRCVLILNVVRELVECQNFKLIAFLCVDIGYGTFVWITFW